MNLQLNKEADNLIYGVKNLYITKVLKEHLIHLKPYLVNQKMLLILLKIQDKCPTNCLVVVLTTSLQILTNFNKLNTPVFKEMVKKTNNLLFCALYYHKT